MDTAGVGLARYAESNPGFDRWFAFRWLRSSVGDPQRRYDHHQYYAVLRLPGWSALGERNPLRCIERMTGYGAIGFRGESEITSADERRRTPYVGIGIGMNLNELLDRTAFAGRLGGGRTQWLATELLRYVQVPGTIATGSAKTWQP